MKLCFSSLDQKGNRKNVHLQLRAFNNMLEKRDFYDRYEDAIDYYQKGYDPSFD
jgi:hypothetical protein